MLLDCARRIISLESRTISLLESEEFLDGQT